jgi:hypothetical protein
MANVRGAVSSPTTDEMTIFGERPEAIFAKIIALSLADLGQNADRPTRQAARFDLSR